MKTTLTTLNKIIPQPQTQAAVNRIIEEGKEFINENFRKSGYATEDFDGEENTKYLKEGINGSKVIVSLMDKTSYFYGPSIGELATGMQQIQKVNNSLNRFNAQNVLMNKIYGSTTFYGNSLNYIYNDKDTAGVWVYNAELGCICPKPLTNTTNMLKFFKFRTDQIDSSGGNTDDNFTDTSITSVSFKLSKSHITMKQDGIDLVPSDGDNGKCIITLTINQNALVKNVNLKLSPNDGVEVVSNSNSNNIYTWELKPKYLTQVRINCIINEGEGDIEYNLANQTPSLVQVLTITKESQTQSQINEISFDKYNTSLNVIKEETNNYIAENNNYGSVTVNIKCEVGTTLNNIKWYTNDDTVLSLNPTSQELDGSASQTEYSFSTEVHPLKPGENIKVYCIINDGEGSTEYNTNTENPDIIPTFTVIDNTPEPEELESFNIDNILWYFRYTPNLISELEETYNFPFDNIDKTNKLFKLSTDDNNLIVYPHKCYISNGSGQFVKFDINVFNSEGVYVFDVYIVLKNNYENIGNIIENDIKVQIEYNGHTSICSKDNSQILISEEELSINNPKIVWKYNENNSDGYIVWKIRYQEDSIMNFHSSDLADNMVISIKKENETIYQKTYKVYCWDMLIQNNIYDDCFTLVDSNENNMLVGRNRQRLYNTNSEGKAIKDTEVFLGYDNEGDNGVVNLRIDNYIPVLLSAFENQSVKYRDSTDGIKLSNSKGITPTYKKDKESEGELMKILFSPSELQKNNGVKYYFQNLTDNNDYMNFRDREDTYSLNFSENHYDGEYRDMFFNYMENNNCVWIRVFKRQENGIWGFNDMPYFIGLTFENITNEHYQDLIKDIPICGIREVLFINKIFNFNNSTLIQPIFIYNNSNLTKQITLKDHTGTLIEYNRTINYTLQPYELLYLPMTNYIYLDNNLNFNPRKSIECTLVSDFVNNTNSKIKEYDNHDTNISNLLTLYDQDATSHILNTTDKQTKFDNYVSSNRAYANIGSSLECNFEQSCPIFEITEVTEAEVPVNVLLHIIQPDTNDNSVDINGKTYPILDYLEQIKIYLTLQTDKETKTITLDNFFTAGKNSNTQGLLYGTNIFYIKYREDNPHAYVYLNGLYMKIHHKADSYSNIISYSADTNTNLNHYPDIFYYTDFYTKYYGSYAPENYMNPNDWYKNGIQITFQKSESDYSLNICISVPLTAFTSNLINNTQTYYIDKDLLYLFRGDSPNCSAYDTLV